MLESIRGISSRRTTDTAPRAARSGEMTGLCHHQPTWSLHQSPQHDHFGFPAEVAVVRLYIASGDVSHLSAARDSCASAS